MSTFAQTQTDFSRLPSYQKRKFVPQKDDLAGLETVKKLFGQLIERPVTSAQELERWLLDRSELESVLDQVGSILYIKMSCQTDDQARASAYKQFIEIIVPAVKPLSDQLNQKYFKLSRQFALDQDRYKVYNRSVKTEIELFNEANVPLQTKVDLLSQEYQTVCGAMTVEFQGKEYTLPQMGKFLLDPDRNLREDAWKKTAQRRLKDKEALEEIFDQMLKLRHQMALNAGFKNYRDYKFKSLHRFDYSPEDCNQYHHTIESIVLPLWKKILQKRKAQMNLKSLRPWDTSVDPSGLPPLKPFEKVDELVERSRKIFDQVNRTFGQQFLNMAQEGLLDLASRKGKAPGGYQSTLNEVRKPFIFMNAVGLDQDVRTLLHEGGHAFHSLACSHDPLLDYRHGPMEFNEVASMSMELLGGEYISLFYGKEDALRSRQDHLEDIVYILIWVAIVDSFQHWIYENPQHMPEQRRQKWTEIYNRFGGSLLDWEGLSGELGYLWHRQLHIFEVPFYYIEYGIAQLGALQVWLNAKKNWAKGIADYQNGLRLGGSKPLPEIFQAAGIRFDFSASTFQPLMDLLNKELGL